MKELRKWKAGILALFLACLPSAAGARNDGDTLVRDNAGFAMELYRRLAGAEGNLFFSPYSISTVLGLTCAGARGETERRMAATLHFTLDRDKLHPAFALLRERINAAEGEGVRLSVANGLWPQEGFPLREEYLDFSRKNYAAQVKPVDYRGAREAARQMINSWVEERTRKKIRNLLQPADLSADTRLVLANAIYFKGRWAEQFKPENTRDMEFHLTAENTTPVPMMTRSVTCRYARLPDLEILELPYAGERLSMLVLLPRELDGIRKIENALAPDRFAEWLGALRRQEVHVYLPKFKTTSRFDLGNTLSAMGMAEAFSARADFSGIAGPPGWLTLSAVIHQAVIEVSEEGTEAAAATGAVMQVTAVPVLTSFRADHPFMYLIRDSETGSILFAGRFADPRDAKKE